MRRKRLVTRGELAVEWAVHPRTIAKFIEEGMPVAKRGRGGRSSLFNLEACQAWRDAREHLAADQPVDLPRERARKERAQALLAEQLYAVRSGKLLPAEDVERIWMAEVRSVRSAILASYTASADRVYRAATTDGLAGVERALKAIAHDVLRELADGPKKRPGKGKAA